MPVRFRVVVAFGAVYLIWGSTYLATHWALESLPPFLLSGSRFVIAGLVLVLWVHFRHPGKRPSLENWRAATVLGCLLLVGGTGSLVWAQQYVPSGPAALVSALTPCLMVLMQLRLREDARPTLATWLGVALGLLGMLVLIGPGDAIAGGFPPAAGVMLVLSCFSWAVGSLYGRRAPLPADITLTTGMQMLCGGSVLSLLALVRGEHRSFELTNVTLGSVVAHAYLIVFGSWIGYSAYVWLMKNTTPARLSTHSYVNPIVAVMLGWWLADEVITSRLLVAAGLSLGGVVLIVLADHLRARPPMSIPAPSRAISGLKRSRRLGGPGIRQTGASA